MLRAAIWQQQGFGNFILVSALGPWPIGWKGHIYTKP